MKKFTKLFNQIRETHLGVLTLLLCFTSMLFTTTSSAQTTATFNASGNFITPAGVTTATVEAWGAGGAGGGSTSNSDGGGGGGGGAYSKSTGVSVSGTVPVVIGAGGAGDTGAGNNGGDSTFNTTTVIAKGGTGGSITSGTGGPGGTGGLSTASTGATKFSGGTGGRGRDNSTGQGGPGGSSAGTAANGTSGAGSWSTVTAAAAPTGGGKGGDGGTAGNDGANGTAPGGGGGGAGDGTNTGGSGANGRVLITYTCPTYALTAATTATGPFCAASASVVTLTSSSMPNGTYTVTYNLSGGNTATGSTASMTFASGSGTFTTSTLNSSATATTITVTGISSGVVGQGACVSTISTNNTATVTVTVVVANAGTAFSKTCTANPSGATIGEASAAGFTYSWSPATGLSSSSISNPTANPATTTIYTVTKTHTASGCSATATVTVTVNNTLPTAVAGADFTKTCVLNPTGKVIGETAVAGNTYSWSPSTGLSSASAANPTANPTSTTTYTVTKTTTASGCVSTDSVIVTVDITAPTVAALTGIQTVCAGSTTVFSSTTADGTWGTSNSGIATVTDGTVTGIASGTTNINYAVTGANGCTTTVSRSVTVNPLPTTVVASGATSICDGASTNLTGSATILSVSTTTPINENFNGAPTFTAAGTGTIFVQRNSGQAVGLTTITNNVDASQYMITSASAFGSATTTSTLTSPAINTNGMSTLSFTYNHSYTKGNSGTNTAVVQVSTDNTNWTTVKTYTTNQGANNNFVADNVNLNAYVNNAALRIRFNTTITVNFGTGWWAVENPKLTATAPIAAQYSWIADTAPGVNGLPSGSGTPATGNASISVNPSATTNYTLVATDSLTGCNVSSSSTVTVIVNPLTTNGDVTTSICSGDTYVWPANGQSYTTEQIGTTFVSGCNTATLNLTIIPSTTVGSLTTTACDSYTWALNSQSYSTTGIYTHVVGCNTATLDLTIVPSTTTGSLTTSACDTYTWAENSQTYTTSGIYTNVVGCNTATLDLTIIPSTTIGSETVSACISYTWAENGQTYNSSGVYTNVVGCNTATLTLTVNTTPDTFYADTDGDGFGSGAAILSCTGQPANTSVNNTDCAPGDSSKWRTANFYIDVDGDSFNNGFPAVSLCYGATVPSGYVSANNGVDCDDNSATANPNASEVLGNGIDDNCDGVIDEVTQTSNLVATQCGITLTNLVNTLFAYDLATYVPQLGPIQGYRFRVTNGATVRTFDSPTVGFNLMNLAGGVTYGTAYTVEVSVKSGGFYRAYGSPCIVNTPAVPNATFVVNPISGSTLSDISNSIFCQRVPTATGYRFRVKDGDTIVGTYSSTTNRFSLINLGIANVNFATTYTIDVLLKFADDWRPDTEYGPTALITTPATPGTSRVIRPICGTTINALWTTIFAQQIVGAQGYKFVVTNGAQTREFATANPRFQLPLLSGGAAANTVYTIRVDVLYNSSYVEGTVLCTLTTSPAATRQTNSMVNIYEVNAYPNPYAETFKLNVNTSSEDLVKISVYDMLGREIESRQANVAAITNVEIGSQYPSGVYNIIVTQGENVKTLRVIKR
ncbi:MAG: T9SS type A sorting domain-containing protein [Flavobacterium sp.]|nr:T9SS type A sorting domain-containing protein [Flavobacterium sp.]